MTIIYVYFIFMVIIWNSHFGHYCHLSFDNQYYSHIDNMNINKLFNGH